MNTTKIEKAKAALHNAKALLKEIWEWRDEHEIGNELRCDLEILENLIITAANALNEVE